MKIYPETLIDLLEGDPRNDGSTKSNPGYQDGRGPETLLGVGLDRKLAAGFWPLASDCWLLAAGA
jgi:hypothetical protein